MSHFNTRILPTALEPGDLVAVVAPASRPDPTALEAGVEILRSQGLKVEVGAHVLDRYGHMAGADKDRAADLMDAFLDPKVGGIICARGGSGSSRMVPYLDFDAIRVRPKVFVGYSDATVLHLALARYAGWPTFYGPMVASEMGGTLTNRCFDALWRIVSRPEPAGLLACPYSTMPPKALMPGTAEGMTTGGTLCVIESAIGTSYELNSKDRLLMLEDDREPPWMVDRMLTHLSQIGMLAIAAGFVVGRLAREADEESSEDELPVEQSLRDHLGSPERPVVTGFQFGHIASPLTIPLNCRALLDAEAGTLAVLEPAVRSRQ